MKSLIQSTLIATALALLIWGIAWFVENHPILFLGGTLSALFFGLIILVKNYRALESNNPTYDHPRYSSTFRTYLASESGTSIEKSPAVRNG